MRFPFVYLNHGALDPDSFDKSDSLWIAFREPVAEKERIAIMRSCPVAVAGFFRWDDRLFYSESFGDVYSAVVIEEYGDGRGQLTAEGAQKFSAEMERWITEIHQKTPVAFFVGPSASLDEDGWNAWSDAQLGAVILPWLEQYLASHPIPPRLEEVTQDFDEDAEPDEETVQDIPTATPMDLATLETLLSRREWSGTPDEKARLSALQARIAAALAAPPELH